MSAAVVVAVAVMVGLAPEAAHWPGGLAGCLPSFRALAAARQGSNGITSVIPSRTDMFNLTVKIADWAFRNDRARAVLAGAGLGWLAWGLSMVPQRSSLSVGMAVVMIGAGAASFACHVLHAQLLRGGASEAERRAEARACVSLLGLGVALAMYLLQALHG